MKEIMYKYVSGILLSGGIIFWFVTFLAEKHYNHINILIWMPFLIIQTIITAICYIFIKKLYRQAHTDMLTGLCSRRYFYRKLSEMKARAPISLIMIDIDNFKSINDTYGHATGDQVLRQLAHILHSNTREKDILARWGGEEFAVILPQAGTKEAFNVADRIRKAVEKHTFSHENNMQKITVSVGIASTNEGADIEMEQFFKIADKALYRAKERKNFIVTVETGQMYI